MSISWSSVGEWAFIFTFCLTYALIANIESRIAPVEGSLAYQTRARVNAKIKLVDVQVSREHCEEQALRVGPGKSAVIWFYNEEKFEYWCGLIRLDKLSVERAKELKPYITVLNSDNYIGRITGEGNTHKRQRENIQQATER